MNDKEYKLQLEKLDQFCRCGEYRDAANQLVELEKTNDSIARELALAVLNEQKGDIYFQAHAFDILYDTSRSLAIDYICQHANTTETYIVGTMISNVTIDSEQEEGREELMKAVEVLKQVLQGRDPEELERISDDIQWFKDSFKIQ